jgi:type II secretory pathway pseudopilin PulG
MLSPEHARGFSLIEALIASLIVASALAGLAHLVTLGATQTTAARTSTVALSLAQSKLEQLRVLEWTYDASGVRVSSPALSPSPPGSLYGGDASFLEHIDAFEGVTPAAEGDAPDYWRTWAITPIAASDRDTLLLEVCVFAAVGPLSDTSRPDVCLSSVKTRKP